MPLPSTVADFWSLIHDHDCRTIVMMNEMDFSNHVRLIKFYCNDERNWFSVIL